VTAVSGASSIPFSDVPSFHILQVEGWENEVEGYSPHAFLTSVLPDYFETMGIPLLAGRTFSDEEQDDSPGLAVISESMARRFWRTESALGARIVRGRDTVSVVGIVGDVRYESMNSEIRPALYVSAMHRPTAQMSFVVNTPLKPESIFPVLREAVWSVALDAPITRTSTVASLISRSTSNEKFRAVVLAIFGISAAVLAAAGVFGVTARGVTRRHREFGIRVALGARQRRLVQSVLRTVLTTGLAGVVSGLILACCASHLLARFLFGVEPADPFTYGAVAALSILVCLSAGYLPARRIASVDPAQVLRSE